MTPCRRAPPYVAEQRARGSVNVCQVLSDRVSARRTRVETHFLFIGHSLWIPGDRRWPGELPAAHHFRDFERVVLVPALAPRLLRDEVPRVRPPCAECFFVFPPDNREPFAVVGRVRLDIDEPGHRLGERRHFLRHLGVAVRIGNQLRAEEHHQHLTNVAREEWRRSANRGLDPWIPNPSSLIGDSGSEALVVEVFALDFPLKRIVIALLSRLLLLHGAPCGGTETARSDGEREARYQLLDVRAAARRAGRFLRRTHERLERGAAGAAAEVVQRHDAMIPRPSAERTVVLAARPPGISR